MKKNLLKFALLALALPLVACGKKGGSNNDNKEQPGGEQDNPPVACTHVDANHDGACDLCAEKVAEAKPIKGTGGLFVEALGYNSKDAAVIVDGSDYYVVYVTNSSIQGEQVFAARKGALVEGKVVYGDPSIVFKGNAESWDKNIFNPSIMKGSFAMGGTTYSYLMAYNGNTTNDNTNNHIGLAVTNNILGEWTRVGTTPLISNPEIYETAYGVGTPSLLSYEGGKGYLFYSVGESELSYAAMKTFDFSNLDELKLDAGYVSLPVAGLDDGQEFNVMVNIGVALSQDGQTLYLVKDRLPYSANSPNQSKAVTVAKMPMADLGKHTATWEVVKRIDDEATMDDVLLGWDQIYSGEFVTDAYGKLPSETEFEVVYSTFSEDGEMKTYSASLASYKVVIE